MIQYKNLVKKFGERIVLNNLTLTIEKAEILFVLGTSGTGKSVLLKNTVGLLKPESGEIWIDGENITEFSEEQLFAVRKKCGMVFQHPALFDSLSIFENVAFGLRRFSFSAEEINSKVKKALTLVHIRDVEHKRPNEISYGMQKRVSLARTIALEPQILLFDEPTTGLDPVTTSAINQLIKELSKTLHTTSIVVSHDMRCALEIADRIIVLDKGKIVEEGTAEKIKKSTVPLVKEFMQEVQI